MSKKLIAMFLILATVFTAFAVSTNAASWPGASSSALIEFKAEATIPVYRYSSCTTRGTASPAKSYNASISANDVCYIATINSSYAYLKYPTSSGYKWGYIKRSALTGLSSPSATVTAHAAATVYSRASTSYSYGSIAVNDAVYNLGTSGSFTRVIYTAKSGSRAYKLGYITTSDYNRIKAVPNSDPKGCFDSVTSTSNGKITVAGWAFDPDSTGKAIDVHVYVGSPAGTSGAWAKAINAGTYRPDVHNVYRCGNYHGFSATFDVPSKFHGKSVTVYVYAINAQGGNNPCIGQRTVTVKGGSTPVVSSTWQYPMSNVYCTWSGYNKSTLSWSEYANIASKGSRQYHLAIDIWGSSSTVYAAASGKVVACSSSNSGANGRYVIIQHTVSGKTVYSFYAHLSSLKVSNGQSVSKGQAIATGGGSANGSNSYYKTHLHFAVVDTLWSNGAYYGYATKFSGNKVSYEGVTYYNPNYIIEYNKLP